MSDLSTPPPVTAPADAPHWTARHGKPIVFVILTMVAVGIYLALTIPVAVFPDTDFPRIVIGVDNGVFPIDQMLVTVTKPLEEAVNTVPGLDYVWSITSRGTAEIDLFFTWKVDMYRTLELVNAEIARIQPTLPPTAKIVANRLTFAAFPIMGYSLTSDTVPQTRIWEMATYDIKPRLNRQPGVSSIVVQGGQVPEFQVQPDPAKLVQTGVTISNILDAIGRSNMIDSPGLIETNHQLVLSLVSGQARTPEEIANIVVKTTPAGAPVRIGDIATVSAIGDARLYRGHRQRQALGAALRLPPAGWQHRAGGQRHSCGDRPDPQDAAQRHRSAPLLRSIGTRQRLHRQRPRRHPDRPGPGLSHHGAVPARLGHIAGGRPGDSRDHRRDLHRPASHGREFQPHDPGRIGRRRGLGDRRCHRGGGEHRDAPR
jgi:hypothetical protein